MSEHKIKVTDVPIGASFTVYMDDYEGPVTGGRATEEEFTIEVPEQFTGTGKIKVFYKSKDRAFQVTAYSIPINIKESGSSNVSLASNIKPRNVTQNTPKDDAFEVKEEKSTVEVIKESVDNELRDDAQATIKKVTKNKLRENIQNKKTGNSFWDKLK